MEITGKTGLLIAGVTAGAALLLNKKPATTCPPGSKLDEASGQCVVIRTVEVQVNGPSGQQVNVGGESEVSKLTYDYNLQARNAWETEAAALSADAKATSEFGSLMALIQAATMFPDTPAGKASVDLLSAQIREAFARIDAAREVADEARATVKFKQDRNALAVIYDAAAQKARTGLTEYVNALKATFLASRDVVDYYTSKRNAVLDAAGRIGANYTGVAMALHLPHQLPYQADKWPSKLLGKLPAASAFDVVAGAFAGISPPSGKTDIMLNGMPRMQAQLAAIRTNFGLYNSWGAIAAGLKDAANPGSNVGGTLDYLGALGRGPGAIFCGRAVAVVTAASLLGDLEKEINTLEILARTYADSYTRLRALVDHAYSVEQGINNGDGLWNADTMRRTLTLLNEFGGQDASLRLFWNPYPNGAPQNKSKEYIKQHTLMWLEWRLDRGLTLAPATVENLKRIGKVPPRSLWELFNMPFWGISGTEKTALTTRLDALTSWRQMIGIVDTNYALDDISSPNAAAVGGAGLNLALVANCADASIPFAAPDYKTMVALPETSRVLFGAGTVQDNADLAGSGAALRTEFATAFNGLRGLPDCPRGTCGGRAKSSSVSIRESGVPMNAGPLRVSIGERVAVRGSGVGGLGSVSRGGGLGGLGDPIQQILSPLMGLNGRRRR